MKLLVANRGEIAVRVLRAARELGIPTVAVHSDADRTALHVRLADEAVALGPAAPAQSYLHVGRLLAAADATSATAIHPGYGFLAENPAFARAVAHAGLTWVGPDAAAIAAMGDKLAARGRMAAAGVPVLPGATGSTAADFAPLGFPLVVKAVAGGGGRGMRVVRGAAELDDAVAAAGAEATAAFGDGRLYAERLVDPARHVEVQVLGDRSGRVVAVGARECSLQRRAQKLLEESPVPGLAPAVLAAMEEAAVRAAAAVGYVGAGTVEFLLAPDGGFWFLEMNTRIQVEHGVTELVTGLDLVAAQLQLALGGAVPEVPAPRGHAFEVRLCAEDVARGFLPSPARLSRVRWPGGPGVRVDAGYAEGDEVPAAYDSLVAKLLVQAEDRPRALARLRRALDELELEGLPHTGGLLRAAIDHPDVAAGAVHTRWLEGYAAGRQRTEAEIACFAAAFMVTSGSQAAATPIAEGTPTPAATPWRQLGSWP